MPPWSRKYPLICLVMVVMLLLYSVFIKNWVRKKHVKHKNIKKVALPILVLACNRQYVKRCLESLIKYRSIQHTFPIIVSQDCAHEATYQIIKSFADQDPTITVVKQPDQSDIPRHPVPPYLKGYYRIARHYKFALNYVFRKLKYKAAIILEDDLEIAPDFYEYFLGTYRLLYEDLTIWCVSAWNDNCKKGLVELAEPELLHRTDFFPGLGWMVRSETWDELEPYWPQAYFDDWLRSPNVTRGRVCIRPEISRTYNFGRYGVSNVGLYDQNLRHMHLNKEFIPFTRYDLSYLLKQNEYMFVSFVYWVPETTAEDVLARKINSSLSFVRVSYTNDTTFKMTAKMFGLMDDLKHGVARTSLHGIVQFFFKGRRVFIAPRRKYSTAFGTHNIEG